MTKEWQEATEEYMKVCSSYPMMERPALSVERLLISTPTATRNRAHNIQARYDGPKSVREASPRPGEDQRRVKAPLHKCVIQTIPIPLFLESTVYMVLFVWYMSNPEGCQIDAEELSLDQHCVISLPVYRILEAFSFSISPSCTLLPSSLCNISTSVSIKELPLQSTGSTLCNSRHARRRDDSRVIQLCPVKTSPNSSITGMDSLYNVISKTSDTNSYLLPPTIHFKRLYWHADAHTRYTGLGM